MLDMIILRDGVHESRVATCESDRDVSQLAECEAQTESGPSILRLNLNLPLPRGLTDTFRYEYNKYCLRSHFPSSHGFESFCNFDPAAASGVRTSTVQETSDSTGTSCSNSHSGV